MHPRHRLRLLMRGCVYMRFNYYKTIITSIIKYNNVTELPHMCSDLDDREKLFNDDLSSPREYKVARYLW